MPRYRLIEIKDKLINDGKPFWQVEKHIFNLWWSKYFEEHSEYGATFYNRDEADTWYNYHINSSSRFKIKVLAQNK